MLAEGQMLDTQPRHPKGERDENKSLPARGV
jgi:hypothetical protein